MTPTPKEMSSRSPSSGSQQTVPSSSTRTARFSTRRIRTLPGSIASITSSPMQQAATSVPRPSTSSTQMTLALLPERRDKHLMAADFFAVDQHPVMSFVSTSVTPIHAADDRFDVTGMLLIRAIERSARFQVQFSPLPADGGSRSALFLVSGTLDRRDFGMIWSNPMVRIAERVDIALTVRTVVMDSATG